MYNYKAYVNRVVDGDTFEATIDLGFKIQTTQMFRLKDIDTPETYRPKSEEERLHGERATEFVKKLIEHKTINIETFKLGIYGRYTASVTLEDGNDLAELLIENGFEKKEQYLPDVMPVEIKSKKK